MIFASISYLNLLPFQIYLKKNIKSNQLKKIALYKKNFPSKINKDFINKKVDAAFISSIKSKKTKCTKAGIIADQKVYSVLILTDEANKSDIESNTSNILAKILNLEGEVLIGDKALKYYLQNSDKNFLDLSHEWYKRYKLPFVFARLCYNSHNKKIEKLAKDFLKSRVKIPQYYLKKEAAKRGILTKELKWYLEHIYYKIGYKEEKSLKLFFKLAKKLPKVQRAI